LESKKWSCALTKSILRKSRKLQRKGPEIVAYVLVCRK
jgi:hypothetical protein